MSNQQVSQLMNPENGGEQNNYDQLSELYQQNQQTKKQQLIVENNGQQLQSQNELPIDANFPNLSNNQYHRRFRASRNFKNPPQPHMCIREKTIDGQELFINVLSWNRIADPTDKNSPIPLFGGMKVMPGSSRSPPLVYAVMASPEVLKQSGRKCPDSPERMNLVDLMCEFVEEMNPGLVLSRHPEILKDRDLSGELKDVWNAVQALRDKQRAENHYTTQENLVLYTEFGPESAPQMYQQQQQQQRDTVIQYSGQSAITNNTNNSTHTSVDATSLKDHMEKISSETENMRISPTETNENGVSNEIPTPLPQSNPTTSNLTSVIMSTGNVPINGGNTGQPSLKIDKKESVAPNYSSSSSSSFLTKFRSSKISNNHHHNQQQQDHLQDTITVQDTNNKKDSDHTEHHQQSKHKKFLSYIRRKASSKNENCTNRDGKKLLNNTSSVTTNTSQNGNEDSVNIVEIDKLEIIETPIIDTK